MDEEDMEIVMLDDDSNSSEDVPLDKLAGGSRNESRVKNAKSKAISKNTLNSHRTTSEYQALLKKIQFNIETMTRSELEKFCFSKVQSEIDCRSVYQFQVDEIKRLNCKLASADVELSLYRDENSKLLQSLKQRSKKGLANFNVFYKNSSTQVNDSEFKSRIISNNTSAPKPFIKVRDFCKDRTPNILRHSNSIRKPNSVAEPKITNDLRDLYYVVSVPSSESIDKANNNNVTLSKQTSNDVNSDSDKNLDIEDRLPRALITCPDKSRTLSNSQVANNNDISLTKPWCDNSDSNMPLILSTVSLAPDGVDKVSTSNVSPSLPVIVSTESLARIPNEVEGNSSSVVQTNLTTNNGMIILKPTAPTTVPNSVQALEQSNKPVTSISSNTKFSGVPKMFKKVNFGIIRPGSHIIPLSSSAPQTSGNPQNLQTLMLPTIQPSTAPTPQTLGNPQNLQTLMLPTIQPSTAPTPQTLGNPQNLQTVMVPTSQPLTCSNPQNLQTVMVPTSQPLTCSNPQNFQTLMVPTTQPLTGSTPQTMQIPQNFQTLMIPTNQPLTGSTPQTLQIPQNFQALMVPTIQPLTGSTPQTLEFPTTQPGSTNAPQQLILLHNPPTVATSVVNQPSMTINQLPISSSDKPVENNTKQPPTLLLDPLAFSTPPSKKTEMQESAVFIELQRQITDKFYDAFKKGNLTNGISIKLDIDGITKVVTCTNINMTSLRRMVNDQKYGKKSFVKVFSRAIYNKISKSVGYSHSGKITIRRCDLLQEPNKNPSPPPERSKSPDRIIMLD